MVVTLPPSLSFGFLFFDCVAHPNFSASCPCSTYCDRSIKTSINSTSNMSFDEILYYVTAHVLNFYNYTSHVVCSCVERRVLTPIKTSLPAMPALFGSASVPRCTFVVSLCHRHASKLVEGVTFVFSVDTSTQTDWGWGQHSCRTFNWCPSPPS